jgi:HK97 family phage prohead protease
VTVIVGRIVDQLGHIMISDLVQGRYGPEVRHRAYCRPAHQYRSTQPSSIVLDIGHEAPIGTVKYLEQDVGGLFAVCEADDADDLADGGAWYFSPASTAYTDGTNVELTGLAMTCSPATVAQLPVTILPGNLAQAAARAPWGGVRDRLRRAVDYDRTKRWGDPHHIATEPALDRQHQADAMAYVEMRSHGLLEYRSASTDTVSRHGRTIELVACPAEQPALIHEPGRNYTEVFTRNAFAGEEKRVDRIRVNRDHDRQRTIGRTLRLDPDDQRGLVAELHIANTELGNETLALAADHCLDASVAFGIAPGGEQWSDGRTRRRITRAFLDHIALVPDPAYEGANIIDVRSYA